MATTTIDLCDQTGNWHSIHLATLAEVLSMPDILTNSNASQVSILTNDETLDILPVPESFNVVVTPKRTKNGHQYAIKIQIDFPYQSAAIDDAFEKFLNEDIIAVGIKPDGTQKIFGSKLYPLKFDYQFLEGKKLEDGSKTRITIKGNVAQKPVFVNC